jgi:hypothetical protein
VATAERSADHAASSAELQVARSQARRAFLELGRGHPISIDPPVPVGFEELVSQDAARQAAWATTLLSNHVGDIPFHRSVDAIVWDLAKQLLPTLKQILSRRSLGPIQISPEIENALRVRRVQTARVHVDYLRDIFGNPFRPVTIDPRWLTFSVLDLSRAIYDERAFERLPILADALMDAGCDNDDILNHCRGDGPHVRGCWVVDLLLGKE